VRFLLLVRVCVVVGLAIAVGSLSAGGVAAASKYKACSLLTAAEVEAVLKKKVSKTEEGDVTTPEGSYKGEVVSGCQWIAGQGALGTYAWLSVTRGPRNPQERAEGLAILKDTFEKLKKQGWSIQEKEFGGVGCATARAPAGTSGNADSASCAAEKRGLGFSIYIAGVGLQVSMEQVKSLTDKAVSRIR
jgi:hypothetical protein